MRLLLGHISQGNVFEIIINIMCQYLPNPI